MCDKRFIVILTIFLCFDFGQCLEIDKQRRYNQNTDFLLNEATGSLQHQQHVQTNSGKRDYVGPTLSSLSTSSTSQQSTAKPTISPNRNYVNPNPQANLSNGKRDYVSPSTSSTQSLSTSKQTTAKPANTPPRRDFVNPKFTTPKSIVNTQQQHANQPGQVQDLINFFDSKGNIGVVTPKPPSYSSILQGTTKQGSSVTAWGSTKQPVTQPTPKLPQGQTTRSYSSIVSGSNKQTTGTPTGTSSRVTLSTMRPMTPVLPSAIVNNNKNSNQASNSVADSELQTLSEELLRKDTNNAAKYVTINYQEKTTSQSKEDKAPLPLLTVSQAAWNIPTIQKFVPLLDNYEKDTLVNEYVTPQERNEENAFMDVIMSTAVIRHMMTFFKEKGYVTPDPRQQRDFLKQLWFGLYSRGKGKISSSGFEHIFVSELKNGEVLGLHNWIYFAKEEAANRINYLGYLKYLPIGDKGAVLKSHFVQSGVDKPVDTMFIGTSPELEIALYTICFVTRADTCYSSLPLR